MNHDATVGTPVAAEEVLDNATFTECMKTFSDGGSIDEEAIAETTTNIRVQIPQW